MEPTVSPEQSASSRKRCEVIPLAECSYDASEWMGIPRATGRNTFLLPRECLLPLSDTPRSPYWVSIWSFPEAKGKDPTDSVPRGPHQILKWDRGKPGDPEASG